MFDATTTGYRCIHGESDGWPGLVLIAYGDTAVLKPGSAVSGSRARRRLPRSFRSTFVCSALWCALSRNIQKAATRETLMDGAVEAWPAGRRTGSVL